MANVTYKGFSFKNWQRNKSFVLTDVDIVKQDLLNHIFTQRGERVGLRNYGTDIQRMLYEPFDEATINLISSQIREVIDSDPRVTIELPEDFQVIPDYTFSILSISVKLFYVELQLKDSLSINLEFGS